MRYRYEVRLPSKFSDVITHDGVPELGVIQDYDDTGVDWEFTDRELYAVLSDARSIAYTKKWVIGKRCTDREIFTHPFHLRQAAKRAEVLLQAVIDENAIDQPPYM
jgi:hypothetical protein